MRRSIIRSLSCAGVVLVATAFTYARAGDEYWVTIRVGDSPSGYTHTTIKEVSLGGERLIETTEESVIRLMRFGQTVKIEAKTVVTETPEGQVRRIDFELDMGSGPVRTERTVAGTTLKVTESAAGKKKDSEQPWDERCVGPTGIREHLVRLARQDGAAGGKLELVVFAPDLGQAATQVFEPLGKEKIQVGGREQELMKIKVTSNLTPSMPEMRWIDAEARPVRSEQDLMGMKWVTTLTDRTTALAALESEIKTDALLSSAISLDHTLPHAYRLDEVTYRLTRTNPEAPLPSLSDERQTIEPVNGATEQILVRVRKRVPAEPTSQERPLAPVPQALAEYLSPSAMLQSDDEKIIAAASAAVGGEKNAWQAARKLERFVYGHVSRKAYGVAFASAVEVLEGREGDCSEHAVLLAALARAAGIPSRIAVGVLYIPGKLAGHMWAEVSIDGAWYALDGTLGLGYAGGAHVAFTKGSFNESQNPMLEMTQMAGNLKGEVLEYRLDEHRVRLAQNEKAWRIDGDTYQHQVLGFVLEKPSDWTWRESLQSDELVKVVSPTGERIEVEYETVGASLELDVVLQEIERSGGKVVAKRERDVAGHKALELLAGNDDRSELRVFLYADDTLYVFSAKVKNETATRAAMDRLLEGVRFAEP